MGSSGSGNHALNCIATVIQHRWEHSGGRRYCNPQGKGSCRVPWQKVGYLFQNFELLDNLTGRKTSCSLTFAWGIREGNERSQRLKQLADYLEITDVLISFVQDVRRPASACCGSKGSDLTSPNDPLLMNRRVRWI